jgi:LmbE family N-acetylglucosaminyl deacetylase
MSSPLPFPPPHSLVWIAAHPDDEILVAPLLAHLAQTHGTRITMIVMTRGERGPNHIAHTTRSPLARIRSGELESSASLLGARLVAWDYSDGSGPSPDEVIARWSRDSSRERIVARIADVIRRVEADLVLGMDPEHGNTGHMDHRAVAVLTRDAVTSIDDGRPSLVTVQSFFVFDRDERIDVRNGRPLDSAVFSFEAHAAGTWTYAARLAALHRSQFTESSVEAFARVPHEQQKVWLRRESCGVGE